MFSQRATQNYNILVIGFLPLSMQGDGGTPPFGLKYFNLALSQRHCLELFLVYYVLLVFYIKEKMNKDKYLYYKTNHNFSTFFWAGPACPKLIKSMLIFRV